LYALGEEAVVAFGMKLVERVSELEARLEELEGKVEKNSSNSSKPPSADGLGKKTKSLRSKSERKTGGQPEHPGSTLEWSTDVDGVVDHQVHECHGCGASLTEEPAQKVRARQVYDIPPVQLTVIEHRAEVKNCPHCGIENQANFPAEAGSVVQYGPRLKSMMVYLMEAQLLPSARTCEILSDLVGVSISEGTLFNTRQQCYEQLAPIASTIQSMIVGEEVVHFDETGLRVKGKLWWLHVACTNGLTYYFIHNKRGCEAIDEMNILPNFQGKAIHDGWKSYQGYDCEHFLCNAHHLRELTFIWEQYQQDWAIQMLILLGSIKQSVDEAQRQEIVLTRDELHSFETRYQTLLTQGLAANPPPPVARHHRRGRRKQSPARNLLDRLQQHQDSVLGFMYDFTVPFDNNQAERDVRMVKLKQKISGTFRSESGAQMFFRLRGYISTLRKQGLNVLDAFVSLFRGYPQSPIPQPE
jgi:transposase